MTDYQPFLRAKKVVVITRWSYYRVGRKAGFPINIYPAYLTPSTIVLSLYVAVSDSSCYDLDAYSCIGDTSTYSAYFNLRKGKTYDHNVLHQILIASHQFSMYVSWPFCSRQATKVAHRSGDQSNQHALHFPGLTKSRLSLFQASQGKRNLKISKHCFNIWKTENFFPWSFWSQKIDEQLKHFEINTLKKQTAEQTIEKMIPSTVSSFIFFVILTKSKRIVRSGIRTHAYMSRPP